MLGMVAETPTNLMRGPSVALSVSLRVFIRLTTASTVDPLVLSFKMWIYTTVNPSSSQYIPVHYNIQHSNQALRFARTGVYP